MEPGGLVGWDGAVLLEATAPDTATLYAPGVPRVFKMGRLPGGDGLVYVSTGFDAASPAILRIDPEGGEVSTLVDQPYLSWPRDIDFARDFSAL